MTTFRKTYAMEAAEAVTIAALAIVLVTQFTTRTVAGVVFLVLWVVVMVRLGAIIGAWTIDRRPTPWTDEERRERAASAARHPSGRRPVPASVEDHYSGPRKIVATTRDGQEAILATPKDAASYMVHNHGPHEGRGLECPEYGRKDGTMVGKCIIDARRREAMDGADL